jgi:ATP-binding cassette, subfamily B, multidrug efflux pump
MPRDYGYIEEEKPHAAYDLAMLKRLYPYSKPYQRFIIASIVLVVLLTLMDLSLPYITKIAIDRYIVPVGPGTSTITEEPDTSHEEMSRTRFYKVDLTDPAHIAIVEKHPALFTLKESYAVIPYESLSDLPPADRNLLRQKDVAGIGLVTLVFLILILVDFGLNFLQKIIMEFTGHKIMHDLRVALFRHIQSLSISFFSKNPVARLVTRTTNDIQNMHELFTSVIAFLFKDVFLLAGISIVLISINWQLALISFTVLPFVWVAALRFSSRARDIFRILRIQVAEINTRFSESISGMKVVQLFLQEKENYEHFQTLNHENYLTGMRQIRLLAVFMPLIEFLGILAVASVVFYGGNRVLSHQMSLGSLVAFISYIRMFFRPIRDISEKYNLLQNAMSSAERIFLILDSRDKLSYPAISDEQGADNQEVDIGPITHLSFKDVSFSYVPKEPVLKNISFTLSAGETLGIVGPTGSGKTTLINLVNRFYDPDKGRITLNEKDLRTLPPNTYLSKMALVMQDPYLFSGTIRDNILTGSAPYAKDHLDEILVASNCKSLVDRSPKGLETELGEEGASLSSGERQLISIARAFARNPELIVLDEATSYIDSQTEHQIQEALFNLIENRTAIVIAHRLATVRQLNRILVVKNGCIIESGSHNDLMDKRGFYFKMHQTHG